MLLKIAFDLDYVRIFKNMISSIKFDDLSCFHEMLTIYVVS